MKKTMITLAVAFALIAASTVAYSFTCEVKNVEGSTVTLECKEKYAKKLTIGSKAKVSAKRAKAIEGC